MRRRPKSLGGTGGEQCFFLLPEVDAPGGSWSGVHVWRLVYKPAGALGGLKTA